MLTNLQLVAYSPQGEHASLSQIRLTGDLQLSMQEEWGRQLSEFCDGVREIAFDPGYKPESDERFVIPGFSLPDSIETNREGLNTLAPFQPDPTSLPQLSALLAYATERGREVILIQRFTRSHVIKPGRYIFMRKGTFESADSPALTLGAKLDAVYYPAAQKLVFHNFRNANSILPLARFYEQASETEIRQVLAHARLAAEDVDRFAVDAPQWFRTRFAMLRDSHVLDEYTPSQIRADATGYLDIEIRGEGDDAKIVFPRDRGAAKRLLQFLNEELYKGPITEKLYETNSKRAADTSPS